jgi:serine/threonine protein kinase
MVQNPIHIDAFHLNPGRVLAGKYIVGDLLGSGWEGEVYRVTERTTGISRAMKLFFPQRNRKDRAVRFYAIKLHRLRHCSAVIQYHHSDTFTFQRAKITFLISDLVEGKLLSDFIASQSGKRLQPYEALHLLNALASGIDQIHRVREYHGDIHDGNILVTRSGIRFNVKLVDFYQLGRSDSAKIKEDVIDLVRILFDAVGGRKHYARQPRMIKEICCGLKRGLITKKFPTASRLRAHLESFEW